LTCALRSFLQYAHYLGKAKLDLAAGVPVVATWSMSSIPRAIAADQVRQLLASIDRCTAVGLRDYAVLLLLARLGLRSGEVTFLKLDDIDWNAGKLSVAAPDKTPATSLMSSVLGTWFRVRALEPEKSSSAHT
jgi:integrase/recombinase XerD